jgi:phosphopantothenoylcysteine decarboxylase/phosphopantothenate--cysteine ligase
MAKLNSKLEGKTILIGLSGGIACYKVADLVSRLVQSKCDVHVIMTEGAAKFITPLTFASLTGNAVFDSQWSFIDGFDPQHVKLARKADAMLVAPCTMNMLATLAYGMTSDPLSLVISAIDRNDTPVLLAPSMNATMLAQASTIRNTKQLMEDGFTIVTPDDGWQACKTVGCGRLPDQDTLIASLEVAFS